MAIELCPESLFALGSVLLEFLYFQNLHLKVRQGKTRILSIKKMHLYLYPTSVLLENRVPRSKRKRRKSTI